MKNVSRFLTLACFCIVLNANAQQELGFSLHYGQFSIQASDSLIEGESGPTFGATFTYEKLFHNSWAIYGGIGLNVLTDVYYEDNLRWPSEHNGSGGFEPDPALPHELKQTFHWYFIDLRLGTKYYFNQNKVRFFVLPYVEGNINFTNRYETIYTYDDGEEERTGTNSEDYDASIRPLNLSVGLGLGATIPVNQSISIAIMPTVDYQLLSYFSKGRKGQNNLAYFGQVGISFQL